VIARRESGDGGRKFLAEGSAVGGGTEADDGIESECRKALVELFGAAEEIADFADDTSGQGEEVTGREAIRGAAGVGGNRAHRCGGDHIRGCRGDEEAFGQAAPSALLGDAHEAVGFEGTQMVMKLLARSLEASGQHGGRSRF